MTRWTSEAVVLRKEPQGESDLWVTLMTPKHGRLPAVAKGALRSSKRFAGVFETARIISAGFMTVPKTGRVMIEHADIIDPLPGLRRHPAALARAGLLLEIVALAAAEHAPAEELYRLLRRGLALVSREPDLDRWSITYAYRLLSEAGYRPCFEQCVHCSGQSGREPELFSPAEGGMVCPECRPQNHREAQTSEQCFKVAPDAVRTLTALLDLPADQLHRVSFTRRALEQARYILGPFIAFHLGYPPRSLEIMARMQ